MYRLPRRPHSLGLKREGNDLCTHCHQQQKPAREFEGLKLANYDSPSHHFHPTQGGDEEGERTGAECVSCHMPARTYMVVDPRHDHSFRVPRPDLSIKLGVPNACTQCHSDQNRRVGCRLDRHLVRPAAETGSPLRGGHPGRYERRARVG